MILKNCVLSNYYYFDYALIVEMHDYKYIHYTIQPKEINKNEKKLQKNSKKKKTF